jgi:hypothetical protein
MSQLILAAFSAAALLSIPTEIEIPAASSRLMLADLRSFFHGDPPIPPKAPPPKQLATISIAPGVVNDPQIEAFLRALAGAIKARDGSTVLQQLSAQYAIDDLPPDRKPGEFFLQAVERIPGPVDIVIVSIDKHSTTRTAKTEFRYGDGNIKPKTFRFDAAAKLVWSDLFALRTQRVGA